MKIILMMMLFFLTACGFQPVHGKYSGSAAPLPSEVPSVEIGMISDREGQMLRNALIDRIGTDGHAPYKLMVDKLEETKKELAITKASEATRAQLRLKTRMILVDRSGREVLSRDLQAMTSYNVLESEFATRVTRNAARENAINDLARQIELALDLYFNRK
ncbi:MAG TPA: LPS assembly lipoprotein LptE [Alphaproteobacteria bacterium]|nr:LPS assembly lipoprotein LptE [Alphaproteobacteria bacterium]HNS44332.1 LPS assembly lipoprotein LptE [Alphaproteobacteria bacterium]